MTMTKWAENEIKYAQKGAKSEKGFEYVGECYKSALKAYKSMSEDGHSCMSWNITASILTRLIKELPLTEIEDTPEVWGDAEIDKNPEKKSFQCTRMFSLFKHVENGKVTYHDVNRAYCVDLDNNSTFNGFASNIVDELWPITMPYYPSEKKYKIYVREFDSVTGKPGQFDTEGIEYVITPDGKKVNISRYYAEDKSHDYEFKPISKEEYTKRYNHYLASVKKHQKMEKEAEKFCKKVKDVLKENNLKKKRQPGIVK